jgi:DNA-binding response OmpR family regulator
VLFLSAHAQDAAKIQGLGLGAADYLTKPFRAAELVARVAAALERLRPPSPAA